MKNETIHIENLSIGYPGKSDVKVVADGICAGINSGELTCLLGANGVGKSTLLRTLSAFQPKLGGEIRIQGKEIESYTDIDRIGTQSLYGLLGYAYQRGQAGGGASRCFGRYSSPCASDGTYVKLR